MKVSELKQVLSKLNDDVEVAIGTEKPEGIQTIDAIKDVCIIPIGVQIVADYDVELHEDEMPNIIYLRFYD